MKLRLLQMDIEGTVFKKKILLQIIAIHHLSTILVPIKL